MARTLTIGSVNLRVAGCCRIIDLAPLFSSSDQRGENSVVPESDGTVANPPREDETDINLRMRLFGERNFSGVAHSDKFTGLAKNAAYLHANLLFPTNSGGGTRTATLTWEALTIPTKPVQVLGAVDWKTQNDAADVWVGILRLRFPEGLFDLSSLA